MSKLDRVEINVSVIVPVYNAEKYLKECIESILNQTYDNFELILIDDGSTDNCGNICDCYTNMDKRVRVIHQVNRGQSAARNYGVKLAQGKWIHFVDSDDVIHPQMLESLVTAIKNTNAKISMCGAREAVEIPGDFFKHLNVAWTEHYVGHELFKDLYKNGKHRYWVIWGKLVDRDILIKCPFTEGRIYEDNAVVCKWLDEAKLIANTNAYLYFYRVNPTGTTKSQFNIKKLDYLWALEEQIKFYKKKSYNEMQVEILGNYLSMVVHYYKKIVEEELGMKYKWILKRSLLVLLYENRSDFIMSKAQRQCIMEAFHPKIMKVYWYLNVGVDTFKKSGLKTFLGKVIKYIYKRMK